MKLLILSNSVSGMLHFRGELLTALAREHEVSLCAPPENRAADIRALGCGFVPCEHLARRSTNPLGDLKLVAFYRRLIAAQKPDLVLSFTVKPNVYGGLACAASRTPFMATITGLGTALENGGALAVLTRTLYRAGLRRAACVFFQNDSNRAMFVREKLVRGRTRLIRGSGVNLESFTPAPYPAQEGELRFLFVGRLMKDKGIGELLEAMRALHREFPEAVLDIIGRYEEDYRAAVEAGAEDGVRYHGLQQEPRPFYRAAHCVVLPSYHEGTSNVMLEASATARPVITTRVPGCRETFDEGVTGFGCEAKDARSLLEAMRRFAMLPQSEREKMGLAARAKMEREYDRNLVIAAYREEIAEIGKDRRL